MDNDFTFFGKRIKLDCIVENIETMDDGSFVYHLAPIACNEDLFRPENMHGVVRATVGPQEIEARKGIWLKLRNSGVNGEFSGYMCSACGTVVSKRTSHCPQCKRVMSVEEYEG